MEKISYFDNTYELEASVYQAKNKKLPTILICHAWAGKDDFVEKKARYFSEQGYHAIALDVYGKGVLGTSKEENIKLMSPFIENRQMLQKRLIAGVNFAKELAFVDSDNLFVIGFCFGGLCALDIARSCQLVKGVISVHGLFDPPSNTSSISAKVLALHGDLDPMVPREKVLAFEEEMTQKGADWQLITFGNTYHAFTNPQANDPHLGTIYNPKAEKLAFIYIHSFLEEQLSCE